MSCYFLDYDILFHESQLKNEAIFFVNGLLKKQMPFLFLSENTLYSRKKLLSLLTHETRIQESFLYTSAMAAIDAILRENPAKNHIEVLGNKAVEELVQEATGLLHQAPVQQVLIARSRYIATEDYQQALLWLMKGARLFSLSDAPTFQQDGNTYIGEGAVSRMLAYAGNQTITYTGFHSTCFYESALIYTHWKRKEVCFVTNHLDERLSVAKNCGIKTLLITEDLDASCNLWATDNAPDALSEGLLGLLN